MSDPTSNKVQIIVAIIGFTGVITAAIITSAGVSLFDPTEKPISLPVDKNTVKISSYDMNWLSASRAYEKEMDEFIIRPPVKRRNSY